MMQTTRKPAKPIITLCLCLLASSAGFPFQITIPFPKKLPRLPVSIDGRGGQGGIDFTLGHRGDNFLAWSTQLEHEYPSVDFQNTIISALQPKVVKLFGDPNFVPYFSKPYDQMTVSERQDYFRNTMQKCFTSSEQRGKFSWQSVILAPPFTGNGGFSYSEVTFQLVRMREARSSLQQLSTQVAAFPATADGYDQLAKLQTDAATQTPLVWPSEEKSFATTVLAAQAREALAALEQKVQAALGSAHGYEGFAGLEQTKNQIVSLLALVTPQAKAAAQNKIETKHKDLLSALLNEERSRLNTFGSGLDGLSAGAAWFRSFEAKYAAHFSDPAIGQIETAFHEARRKQLAAAARPLEAKLNLAKSTEAVDDLMARYLSLPGDSQAPELQRVQQLAEARKEKLEEAAVLGSHSPEPQTTARESHAAISAGAAPPVSGGEPSEENMYQAVRAHFEGVNDNLKDMKQRCQNRDYKDDPVMAMQCLVGALATGGTGNVQVKITRFEKIACAPLVARPGTAATTSWEWKCPEQ